MQPARPLPAVVLLPPPLLSWLGRDLLALILLPGEFPEELAVSQRCLARPVNLHSVLVVVPGLHDDASLVPLLGPGPSLVLDSDNVSNLQTLKGLCSPGPSPPLLLISPGEGKFSSILAEDPLLLWLKVSW